MNPHRLRNHFTRCQAALRAALGLGVVVALAACNPAPAGVEVWDPYEADNRGRHAGNLAVDSAVLRRGAYGYGETVPEPVRRAVGNFADNLSLPGAALNSLLQGRPDAVVENTFRFLINSTIGLAGLFDPASEFGLPNRPTDFGETLHVWGASEGAYLELPLLGPSTERDAIGLVADIAMNPVRLLLPSEARGLAYGSRVIAVFGDRYEFTDAFDATLYDSADSYAQARLIYLQNRRFQLGDDTFTIYFDPYEDLDGD